MFERIKFLIFRSRKIIVGKDVFYCKQINIPFERIGNKGADFAINLQSLNKDSVIYSFGIGQDISFDLGVISKTQAKILAFDPTPRSKKWLESQTLPSQFEYYEVGLAPYDGEATFETPQDENHVSFKIINNTDSQNYINAQVRKLSTLMKQHHHKKIDVLKIDIEGAEYEVVKNILDENIEIKQILVEVHHRFSEYQVKSTKELVSRLKEKNYKLFYVSPSGEEFSFIKQ